MIRLFIAGAYSRREELLGYGKLLAQNFPVTINARWLELANKYPLPTMAIVDMVDAMNCDLFIRFSDFDHTAVKETDMISAKLATGSRMVEMGLALAKGIPVVVVGGKQNLYDYLPSVTNVANVEELFAWFGKNITG